MPDQQPQVIVVDSLGKFPLFLLARVLRVRIEDHGKSSDYAESVTAHEVDHRVERLLERVSIIRVFDIEGLWEVARELADDSGKSAAGSVEMLLVSDMASLIHGLFGEKERNSGRLLCGCSLSCLQISYVGT